MASPRTAAFRAAYRSQIAPLYNGLAHVALIYLIGGAALWYAIQHIHAPRWTDWLIVPIAAIGANVFEWFLHAQIMHRPRRGFMGIYKRHTLAHHQFFTAQEPFHDSTRDFRIVFFPPYALIGFLVMAAGLAWVTSLVWSANAAWLLVCTASGMYLNYEFFHWCCHVRDDRIIRFLPFANTIRRHHIAHHDTSLMMHRNMNLTYPFADWLFGTSDLDRGLLGHLFNGYDTRFVKTARKPRGSVEAPSLVPAAE
ncbi:MAG: hypothetical protein J0H67_15685 [Rhodospirillales bacterium]|nr:hypothetical protein [Rhodospirillales bacterium]